MAETGELTMEEQQTLTSAQKGNFVTSKNYNDRENFWYNCGAVLRLVLYVATIITLSLIHI